MNKLVLYGAGVLGRELIYLIECINRNHPTWDVQGFVVDDKYYQPGQFVEGSPVLGTENWLLSKKDEVYCICAVGEPEPRERIQSRLMGKGVRFATLIAPGVEIPSTSSVGQGAIIQSQTIISVNVHIGDGVLLNFDNFLGHDVQVDDYACIMGRCSLNGYVHVGRRVFMGGAAYIVPHVEIGQDAVVAAGSVVFNQVKEGTHVLGNPARRINL